MELSESPATPANDTSVWSIGAGCGERGGHGGPAGGQVPGPPQCQIQAWKKALTEGAAGVFGNGQDQKARSDAALTARLYQEIGQLKVERDFLAERSGQ